jgi:pyruvate,water dikinase
MVMEPFGKYFLTWNEAFRVGTGLVGGKGWNLARLACFGFRIPIGGVLTTDAYHQFIARNKLERTVESVSQTVKTDNLEECDDLLSQLRDQIRSASLPPRVVEELAGGLGSLGIADKAIAVRSSATAEDSAQASFAGVHDSYLNVIGQENVLNAVKACYASLWTPQAVAYRRRQNISDHEVIPAVVLMVMVDARSAGIAFTCDPQTGRHDLFVINANFGLGESVVSGDVEPDTYYLDTSAYVAVPRLIFKRISPKQGMTQVCPGGGTHFVKLGSLSSQQVLSDEDIKRLGLILMRVFEALGECEQHQDVEWAFDGRDIVLLQARPVTALPRYTFDAVKNKTEIWSNGN